MEKINRIYSQIKIILFLIKSMKRIKYIRPILIPKIDKFEWKKLIEKMLKSIKIILFLIRTKYIRPILI